MRYHECLRHATESFSTVDTLTRDLRGLGVKPGMTLIVHSSLSSIGYVCGGVVAVVLALEKVLGPRGTLAMPTHTELTDPKGWPSPGVPEAWWPTIRATMVPFDPKMTPARRMGAVPDCFRTQQGALRSRHPFTSWAARGVHAKRIVANHRLAMSQGETSPLARLYERNAQVLLLGVGYNVNTSFHLAEYRCRWAKDNRCQRAAPMRVKGDVRFTEYDDITWHGEDFKTIGKAFERTRGAVTLGRIGHAESRLFSQRAAVDFAVRWMNKHRGRS